VSPFHACSRGYAAISSDGARCGAILAIDSLDHPDDAANGTRQLGYHNVYDWSDDVYVDSTEDVLPEEDDFLPEASHMCAVQLIC